MTPSMLAAAATSPTGHCYRQSLLHEYIEAVRLLAGSGLLSIMVGLVRFELTTSCTPCKRATRLRYSPN